MNMRSLLSGETDSLKCMPIGILRLTNLRRFDKFVVGGGVEHGKPSCLGSMKIEKPSTPSRLWNRRAG